MLPFLALWAALFQGSAILPDPAPQAPAANALRTSLPVGGPLRIDPTRVFVGRSSFDLVVGDRVEGHWRFDTSRSGGLLEIREETRWLPRGVVETTHVGIDVVTLRPRTLALRGDFGGRLIHADLRWQDGRIDGSYRSGASPDSLVTRRHQGASGPDDYERTALFALLTGADLEPGSSTRIAWFQVFGGAVESVTVAVGEPTEITVPAGRFAALPVTLGAASQPNVVYLTVERPRRILRVDVPGQPMIFVRRPDAP